PCPGSAPSVPPSISTTRRSRCRTTCSLRSPPRTRGPTDMRATAKIFWILAVFFLIVAIAYGILTGLYEPLGLEPVGFPALLALTGLSVMIAMATSLAAKNNYLGGSDELDGE